jgi:uncharacterized protein YqhQ
MSDLYGGQAVIEGVMMRGPHHFAVAARRANGEIAITCEAVPYQNRPAWQKLAFLRGVFGIVGAMRLGTRSLLWAAKIAEEEIAETDKPSGKVMDVVLGSTVVLSLALAIFFKTLPQIPIQFAKNAGWPAWQIILMDFTIRVVFITGYLLLIARMKHVFRVFQYHGAEHKAINALEAGKELTVENVRAASRLHPRCGTSFLFGLIALSVLAMSYFNINNNVLWQRILIQVGILPVMAGVMFEILRLGGKFRNNAAVATLSTPGLWTQYLTTREPDDSQIEVSIASLKAAMAAENGNVAEARNAAETQTG